MYLVALLGAIDMWSKEMSMQVKEDIIRLKKQQPRPIREITKTLGVAK